MGIFNLSKDENERPTEKDADKQAPVESVELEPEVSLDTTGTRKQEGRTIILDGPLSHAFTQALNVMYAKEALGGLMSVLDGGSYFDDQEKAEPEETASFVDENGAYVYTVDSSNLDQDGLVMAVESIRKASKKFKHVYVAMESRGARDLRKTQLLDEYSASLGAKVVYSRERALQLAMGGR